MDYKGVSQRNIISLAIKWVNRQLSWLLVSVIQKIEIKALWQPCKYILKMLLPHHKPKEAGKKQTILKQQR